LGLRGVVGLLLAFGLPAALIVAPWYAKNLVWFGNPVWPVLAPNPTGFNQYLGNTSRFPGTGGLLGPILLPAYLYLYGWLVLPTAQTIATVFGEQPLPQLVGLESRQAFLARKLDSYPLLAYLNDGHEPVSKVLMVGDYRSYYLHQPVWVDVTMETVQRLAL